MVANELLLRFMTDCERLTGDAGKIELDAVVEPLDEKLNDLLLLVTVDVFEVELFTLAAAFGMTVFLVWFRD